MGPLVDCSSWAAPHQLFEISATGIRLALFLPSIGATAIDAMRWGLLFGPAGAIIGGIAVRFAGRKRTVTVADLETERRALDRANQHFLAAAESSMDAFYILESRRDEHGAIVDFAFTYLNRHAEQRLNCHRDELLGTSYRSKIGPFLTDTQFDQYCRVVTTGVPLSIELPVTVPSGKITWLHHQVVKLGDGIAISSSDLTTLKSIEERFQNVARFSDTIFENAPFTIIATDANGLITAMNKEAESLTGYSAAALINKESFLLLHDPDELRLSSEQIAMEEGLRIQGFDLIAGPVKGDTHDVLQHEMTPWSGRSGERLRRHECTFVHRDGTRIHVCLAIKVLCGPDGARTGIVAIANDIAANKTANNRLLPFQTHDPLTGLIGQGVLEDRLSQAIKRARRASNMLAVMTIDLDHFKRINDEFGHQIGDEVLTLATARLHEKVRSADTIARLGGDEFIVVVSDQARVSDIEFCANLFHTALCAPYSVHGHTINVTASIGISIYPNLAEDTENLLRRSEAAMYAAKDAGRNLCTLFAPRMLEDASSRLSMEGALRQALDRNELYLEYQPQIALPGGTVIGMEALMRWRHPRFGLVSPAHFIPMAERLGLLPEFGAWAMRRACREAKWIQDRLERRITLSVNLSPQQFQQKRLLQDIQDSLHASGLAPSDLDIEIIESTLMINSSVNLKMLQQIRDLGVCLSIDDFGTGFCNFNYLLQYQVDRLKIDQSFVRQAATDPSAASVVRTVIAMSHGLGIKVIAEGVETREQLKFLMRRRCDEAQGFYFARPVSPEQFVLAVPEIEAMDLNEPSGEHLTPRHSDLQQHSSPVDIMVA